MNWLRNHKGLAIIGFAVVAAAVLGLIVMRQSAKPVEPNITATATPELSAEQRALIERLSKELVSKYYTYSRPDDPAYLASFRPYVSDRFYDVTVSEIQRYSGRLGNVSAVVGTPGNVEFDSASPDRVEVGVKVNQKYASGESFDETAYILWKRASDRWVASYVVTEKSIQNLSKYGEQE